MAPLILQVYIGVHTVQWGTKVWEHFQTVEGENTEQSDTVEAQESIICSEMC